MASRSAICRFILATVLGLAAPPTVRAVVPLVAPPVPKRVVLADLVITGKVTAIEDDLVEASSLLKIPGVSDKVSFRVAVVTIDSILLGAKKDETKVRVAVFQPVKKGAEDRPWRPAKLQLAADQ